jgi:peroxiredoxin
MTGEQRNRLKTFAALSLLLSVLAVLSYLIGPTVLMGGEPPGDPAEEAISFDQHLGDLRILLGLCLALAAAALVAATIQLFRFRQAPILAVVALMVAIPVTLASGWMNFNMARVARAEAELAGWSGVTSPDITFDIIDGDPIRLSDLRGKRVLINYWATWCPPCREEMPSLIKIVEETSRDEVVVIGLSPEEADVVREGAAKLGVNYPLAVVTPEELEALPEPYTHVPALPTSFLIDRNGIIQKIQIGMVTHNDLVRMLVAGEDYQGEPKAPPA